MKISEQHLRHIVRECVETVLSEKDRHREGYWAERWAKQKAAKQAVQTPKEGTDKTPSPKTSQRKDRHRKGYYRQYNMKHPERLNRGFTKGYIGGCVDNGPKYPEIRPGEYLLGYDEFGMPITTNPIGDLLRHKEMEWHDDDWEESQWGD